MALIAASVGNKGVMMAPHVLQDVRNRDNNVVQSYARPRLADDHDEPVDAGLPQRGDGRAS